MSPPIRAFCVAGDAQKATLFASRILTLLAISQILLLALAWTFMPAFVEVIAPGFDADPAKFDLAVRMTRITFPYLGFVTIATLHTGTLNAHGFFAAGAFAPVLLNVFVIRLSRACLYVSRCGRRGELGRFDFRRGATGAACL